MKYRTMNSFCKASTLSLHSIDINNTPLGYASGCIINTNSKRIILTAKHAINKITELAIKVEITDSCLQKYYKPNFTTAVKGVMNVEAIKNNVTNPEGFIKEPESVDISVSTIPKDLKIFNYNFDPQNNVLNGSLKNELKTDFKCEPDGDECYFFWGETSQIIDYSIKRIKFKEKFVTGMKYIKTLDDYYLFEVDELVQEDNEFTGTSGAPIFDSNRNIVSIVCGGIIGTNFIYGMNLQRYKVLVDLESEKLI